MRHLAATLAAAAAPVFGLWNLQADLANASKNAYGDVQPKTRLVLAGHGTLVRCGDWCRLGRGWLAFRRDPRLARADVARAQAGFSKRLGWNVRLTLTPAGRARWTALAASMAAQAKLRGVPDVLVVVAGGEVAALPLATQVQAKAGVLTLTGFSKASAAAAARSLR